MPFKHTICTLLVASAGLLVGCKSNDDAGRADEPQPGSNAHASHTPQNQAITRPTMPTMADTTPADMAGLHNVVAFHDGFLSGSVPEGDAGFDTLRAMGVRTIISVDGAAPDAEAARARGMKYIHLPIGYAGFDEQRSLELARATRDGMRDGAVYIHCHHGKHRSAGAAATVAGNLGWATPETSIGRMRVSGTSPSYTGLYRCAQDAAPVSLAQLESVGPDFPEVSVPSGLVAAMVEIDEIMEHLKAIEKAGWTVPPEHPDLVPAAEAGRMADIFRVLGEGGDAASQPLDFVVLLDQNWTTAQGLEDMIVAGRDAAALTEQLKLVTASCTACHTAHRN